MNITTEQIRETLELAAKAKRAADLSAVNLVATDNPATRFEAFAVAAANQYESIAAELLAAREVIARLPRTADGEVVVPGSTVWVEWPRTGGFSPVFIDHMEARTMHADVRGYISAPWDKCYSTLAAATAARGGEA